MRAYDLIQRKRDGAALEAAEIRWLIDAFLRGEVADAQMAAFLMAVYFRGMTAAETAALTLAMADSGERLDLSGVRGPTVDKHSSGGVGDKTSLVLVPLVASAGVRVAKLSGRALGHTGGTLDKLEAIPGLRTDLSPRALIAQVNRIGCAIAGQSEAMVPADKRLYALRDATATVESVPLIASSIMSKKIAAGSAAIVLDVKTGRGAFLKTPEAARALAEAMVEIGRAAGRRTMALITAMDEPLGRAVGNALEVDEAIRTLRGEGPADLKELCLTLGAQMVVLAGLAPDTDAARRAVEASLSNGAALRVFQQMIAAQGGDARVADDTSLLPRAAVRMPVSSGERGVVMDVDARGVSAAAMTAGAGRQRAGDRLDPGAGVTIERKVGDLVRRGAPLAMVYAGSDERAERAVQQLVGAYTIGPGPALRSPLIRDVLT